MKRINLLLLFVAVLATAGAQTLNYTNGLENKKIKLPQVSNMHIVGQQDGLLLGVTDKYTTFLKNHIKLTLPEFMAFVHDHLCEEDYMLSEEDIKQIEVMELEYLSDEFIYGKNPRYTLIKKRRIEGVGEFEARIELKNGIIKSVNLMGDFFLIGDLDNGLLNKLKGVPLEAGAISRILPDRIDDIIMNLLKVDFILLLTD